MYIHIYIYIYVYPHICIYRHIHQHIIYMYSHNIYIFIHMHTVIYIHIHTHIYLWYTEVYTHTCAHAREYFAYSYTESDFLDAERKRGVLSATTSQPSHTLYFFVHVRVGGGWSGVGRHIHCVCMCAMLSTQRVLYFQSSGQCGEASRQRAQK